MDKNDSILLKRRKFIHTLTGILAGAGLAGPGLLLAQKDQKKYLPDTLTPEEQKWLSQSAMAKDMGNYFGKGFSCAEAGLMVTLNQAKLNKDMVWAAGAFGGGLGARDLCGFLTGGMMGLGLVAGSLKIEKKSAKKKLSQARKTYWQWWKNMAPLHCSEIRPKGSPKGICQRLGQLAAAKLEEIIKDMLS